jgi:uncharacterized protein YxeA
MVKKIILGILILLVLLIGGFAIFVQLSWDKTYDIPYPDLKVSMDSMVIERGRYLVHGPALFQLSCFQC